MCGLALIAITAVTGFFGFQLKPNYSTENYFPVWSEARRVYDRYQDAFPTESANVFVIVRDDELWTHAGLRRVAELEAKLQDLPNVLEVQGPMSADDITGDLTPQWGLHLIDANVGLGNLVDIVRVQAAAWQRRR